MQATMWIAIVLVAGLGAGLGAWWMARDAQRHRDSTSPTGRRAAVSPAVRHPARATSTSGPAAGGFHIDVEIDVGAGAGREPSEPFAPTAPMGLGASRAPASLPAAAPALPAELAAWTPVPADSLPPHRLQGVVKTFHDVPRPPRLLARLVGLDLAGANVAHELVDLINGEPLIAAKVLAAVNAPAYGLQRPVGAIGQAVTYLGLDTVRGICMHHALQQGFHSDSADRAERLNGLWRASAMASELAQQTSPRAGLPDPGGLACSVLLSFLGELACSVAVPRGLLGRVPARDHFARTCAEQALIGLGAPQIGRVLMRTWDLPEAVIASVTALDTRLVQPVAAGCDTGALRDAWGYLCARLGERLAAGELASPADFDLAADGSIELAAIRPLHADARFAALVEQLSAPALQARIEALKLDRRSAHAPPATQPA